MSRKQVKIHPWAGGEVSAGWFAMIAPELAMEPKFRKLSHAARAFYLTLVMHRETEIQQKTLYTTLTQYNTILGLGMTDFDIKNECFPSRKSKYTRGLFVAPQAHLELYGYGKNYVSMLKKELIEAGFIRLVYGGKGRFCGFSKNCSVYAFCNDWMNEEN